MLHYWFLTVYLLAPINSEVFTALDSIVNALRAEQTVAHWITQFVISENKKLDYLEQIADEYIELSTQALQNPEVYVSDPIAAYLAVKRMTSHWNRHVEPRIKGPAPDSQPIVDAIDAARRNATLSSKEDFSGVAIAIARLQTMYQLEPLNIVNGKILNFQSDFRLSATDCFNIAQASYNIKDLNSTLIWSRVVLELLGKKGNESVSRAKVLDYLSFAEYKAGNLIAAKRYAMESLILEPDQLRLKSNILFYENRLQEIANEKIHPITVSKIASNKESASTKAKINAKYESLCRRDNDSKPKHKHRLSCRLIHNSDPRLILMPIKEETILDQPWIVTYHDILSDYEIEIIKSLARPRLRRALVGNGRAASFRISKSGWINDEENIVIAKISSRINALLQLSIETVEPLQVVNYGLGGHYTVHSDFSMNGTYDKRGNRIATLLFYMSDVELGGATVFPNLGVGTVPKKGTAVFWFNLYKNGRGDNEMIHAACPVLIGNKWAANKWFHERGQEFLQPCGKDANSRFGMNDFPQQFLI